MRTTTSGELTLLHTPQRAEGAKITITRAAGGAAVDLTGRVKSGSYQFSADNPVAVADIDFEDLYTEHNTTTSLNPLLTSSSYNSPSALLWPNADLHIYLGVNTLGTVVGSSELKLVFHGVLGDEITPGMSQGKRTVSIHCRDQAKRLQKHFIVGEYVYGDESGTAAVAVIQSILNDSFTWDTSSSDYKKLHIDATAYTNCDFVIYPMKIGNMSCWDAIRKVIRCTASDDIGFELRYRFLPNGDTSTKDNEGNTITVSGDDFYLCLLQIDQSKSVADDSISTATDEVEEESFSLQDDTIRNSIYGRYIDRNTKDEMELHRDDADSIATYERIDMVIGQVDVPWVDTFNEMWDLLGVALNALKDLPATDRITTQLLYHTEPNDLLDMTNAQLATGTTKMGVMDIRCSFAPGGGSGEKKKFTTTITGVRDRIIGQISDWLAMTGGSDPEGQLPPTLGAGEARSVFKMDNEGNGFTETVFSFPVPGSGQIEKVEWRYAVQGEGLWHEQTTTEPRLVVLGLRPGATVPYVYRARITGGER